MTHVLFYTKRNCPLCDECHSLLTLLNHDYRFTIEERDIYTNDAWLEKYQLQIPYVQIGDTELNAEQITMDSLENALKQAQLS